MDCIYKKIDLSLDRIAKVLAELGNPHHKLPPTIHVAGTNGKGSTIAFLRAILEENGRTCHVYTSPHLVKFNERIVLAGQEISDEYLGKILDKIGDFKRKSPAVSPSILHTILHTGRYMVKSSWIYNKLLKAHSDSKARKTPAVLKKVQ